MLDAVLPLTLHDYPRSRILTASLAKNFTGLGTVWVVVRDREYSELRTAFVHHPSISSYEVLPESVVAPELRFYPWLRRKGWYIQQLIKLAITPWIQTPFYLTLDADIICTKPTTAENLIRNGHALSFRRYQSDLHAEWYAWAERVLGIERSGLVHGVTPAILNTTGVNLLQQHLTSRTHPLIRFQGWRGYLLRHIPWTEYTLYFTFLEGKGLYDQYHVDGDGLCGKSVWFPNQLDSWTPPDTHFAVVQSTAVDTGTLLKWMAKHQIAEAT